MPGRSVAWSPRSGILALPALVLAGALGSAALIVGFLGWWAALFTGRMPEGLRNLGAVSLRYSAQATRTSSSSPRLRVRGPGRSRPAP